MLIESYDSYEILGIDRDADTKTIKKAYAALVKQYHPEEYPEEWQKIHDAYEYAMGLVSDRKRKLVRTPEREEQAENLTETDSELENLFNDVERLADEQREDEERTRERRLNLAMSIVRRMTEKKKLRIEEWRAFFSLNEILPIISQREFLRGMGDCLTSKKIDDELYAYLMKQLDEIVDYLEQEGASPQEINRCIHAVEFVKGKVRAGHEYYYYTIEDWLSDNKIYIVGFILFFLYLVSVTMNASW